METAAESKNAEIAEDLLLFFTKEKKQDAFTACLYKCYDLLRPDVVMEVAWRHGLQDYAMPYLIQVARSMFDKIKILEEADSMRAKRDADKAKQGLII